jgi:LmbE family N-acetylglucosaminyl deacetylase
MLESIKKNNILVVVAHPDDEVLGVGGTIIRLVSKYSCNVRVLILGEGLTSRNKPTKKLFDIDKKMNIHKKNILDAQKILGYQSLTNYNLPDNKFDTVPLLEIIKIIEKEKNDFKPKIVFTHHLGDVNIDHQLTFQAVCTACRPLEGESVNSIISFETLSGTEWIPSSDPRKFSPNFFISLEKDQVDRKIQAMESYFFEKRKFPHPRSPESIKNTAKAWGSTNGKYFAEAFQIIRRIE